MIWQRDHEKVASRIEFWLPFAPFVSMKDPWDASAKVLDVMQLVEDVDQARISMSLNAVHDLLQCRLIYSTGVGYFDSMFLVENQLKFHLRDNP